MCHNQIVWINLKLKNEFIHHSIVKEKEYCPLPDLKRNYTKNMSGGKKHSNNSQTIPVLRHNKKIQHFTCKSVNNMNTGKRYRIKAAKREHSELFYWIFSRNSRFSWIFFLCHIYLTYPYKRPFNITLRQIKLYNIIQTPA